MSAHNDIELLRRRLDTLIRAATRIRTHAPDLFDLGWEQAVTDVEKVNGGAPDRAPNAGNPRARRLFDRIASEVSSIEAELVGLDRTMMAIFTARSERPEPSRGSTISHAEFERLKANQGRRRARGEHVPAQLEPQPQHPGRRA